MRELARNGLVSLVGLGICGWASGALAQPQTGDFFITESTTGEVTNIAAGGDMSATAAFASGIPSPMGLCRGPGGDMYVSSQNTSAPGAVYVITAGGDFSSATPFAVVPQFPSSLSCTPSEVLVATIDGVNATSEIYDITAGGDFTSAAPFADGFATQLWTIYRDPSGNLWGVTEAGTIYNASGGGDVSGNDFATGLPGMAGGHGLAAVGSALYVGAVGDGSVYDYSGGGDLSGATAFAHGAGTIRGLYAQEGFGFYAASQSIIYDVSAGNDISTSVFAHSLDNMVNAQMLYWHGCGDSIVWTDGGEECDDGNTDPGDGCSETCTSEGTGGGGPGGGGGTGGTGGTGATGGTGGTGGTAGSTTTPPTDSEDDDGCGCRVAAGADGAGDRWPLGATALLLIGLAGFARRGKRR